MSTVSIVIPAFNEEGAIGELLTHLRTLPLQAEVIVIDDASSDATARIAAEHGARVIRHAGNCGYGRSVKDGVALAMNDTIIVTDADGTYPIDQIPLLLETYEKGFDMVVGARQGAAYRGTFLKMPARYVFKAIVEFTTGRRIPDINSGLRIFSKRTVEPYFRDICNGYSFTTTITLIYLLTGKMVTYVTIPYNKRIGRSKVRIVRDSLRTLQYITECIVRYNPLKLFLLFSFFSVIVGAIGIIFSPILFFVGIFFAILIFAVGCVAEALRGAR